MSTMTAARLKIKPTRFEPSDEDKAWAAANLSDEPDYDAMAGEAAYLAWCEAMTLPPVDYCRSCGELAETDRDGLCADCGRA